MDHGPNSTNKTSLRPSIPICVVDDHEALLKISVVLLQDAGFPAFGTRSPDEALRGIQSGSFRILLVDVRMPQISGFAFLERALQLDPAVKVILVTGFYSDAEANTALDRGAFAYLPKPMDWRQLFSILDRVAGTEPQTP
jgi:DNA-binding NtrC family response regulator